MTDSVTNPADQPLDWGREPELSAFETMTWRLEADARLRSTITHGLGSSERCDRMNRSDSYRGGSGPPLVLLHGVQGSWRIWRPVLPYLEPVHEVYAPTLPGHRGAMPIAADRAGFTGFADLLETQLDDAGLTDAHLVGNSLGAAVAIELARRGRARSVVAIAPPGGWRSTRDMNRALRLVRTGRSLALRPSIQRLLLSSQRRRRQLLRVGFEHGDRISELDFNDMLQDLIECTCLDAVLTCIARDGALKALPRPGCPIRVAWPQYDRTIPYRRFGARFAELIPDAEIVMLPGVGHVPMYDDPALVARSILHVTQSAACGPTPTTPAEQTPRAPSEKRG